MSLIERFGRTATAGTVLFREGDSGTEMFVIQSGFRGIQAIALKAGRVAVQARPGKHSHRSLNYSALW